MTKYKLKLYTDHLCKMREYLYSHHDFDYPFYGGIKSKFTSSHEACDAFQNIWHIFTAGDYKSKKEFVAGYVKELNRLGEKVK